VVVVSQAVARHVWPGQDAVGKRISMQDDPGPNDWLTVIGVVNDVVQDEQLTRHSTIYLPYLQTTSSGFINHMTYVVRPAPGGALMLTRVLTKSLFEVQPTDPVTLVAVTVVLVLVALVAGFVPAQRATRIRALVALLQD